MTGKRLRVATCQFPVTDDVRRNGRYIRNFIARAGGRGADVVHLSEAALSGYGRADFPTFRGYDWQTLRAQTRAIQAAAAANDVWVILGSAHFLGLRHKPTNCLYIINGQGRIVDRYDKSFCTGGDLKVYSPGNHLVTVKLKGLMCGFLICYDGCYPEIYNAYRHRGVTVMFHSFYNAGHRGANILDEYVPAKIRVRASDNQMWVVANNSCRHHSSWPTCIARPDGSLAKALTRHVPGILYHDFPDPKLKGWLHNFKMMKIHPREVFHNGIATRHPRATNRQTVP